MGLFDLFKGGGDRDRFGVKVADLLNAHDPSRRYAYDRKGFAVEGAALGDRLGLGSHFRQWQLSDEAGREKILEDMIKFVFREKQVLTFADAAPRLLPAIRRADLFRAANAQPSAAMTPFRPFGADLAIAAVIDSDVAMDFVTQPQLEAWSSGLEAALDVALTNLRALGGPAFERAEDGVYISAYGDGYDASRLLMPEHFGDLDIKGAPIACPISAACVVIAGSEDMSALSTMVATVDQAWRQSARPLSALPLILHDGEWRPLDILEGHFAFLDQLHYLDQHLFHGKADVKSVFG